MGRKEFGSLTPAMSRQNNNDNNDHDRSNCGGNQADESDPTPNWQEFLNFLLQRMTEKTAEYWMRYAKQFVKIITGGAVAGDASELLQLSPDKRIHAMKALSNLSTFNATYDQWLQLGQRYNLTWSTGTEKLDAFTRFFDDSNTLDTMLQWLSEACQELPKTYSNFFMFCTLTGLRSSECVNCISLIQDPES
jgi:hypothetical protein